MKLRESEAARRKLNQQAMEERRRKDEKMRANQVPGGYTVEYMLEDTKLIEHLGLDTGRFIKFSGKNLDGYLCAGSSSTAIRAVYIQRPHDMDDHDLWTLLQTSVLRQSNAAKMLDKAVIIASRRGVPAPEAFVCPITLDVMCDPVIASDGHTYEFAALAETLHFNPRSPLTKAPMRIEDAQVDLEMRAAIEEWAGSLFPWASISASRDPYHVRFYGFHPSL